MYKLALPDGVGIAGPSPPAGHNRQPRLYPNAPNPFNPSTSIRFELPLSTHARLAIYDQSGRLIRTLVDATLPAGSHSRRWDGLSAAGVPVASGRYTAVLEAAGTRADQTMLLLK